MIEFDRLERDKEEHRDVFANAKPFSYIILDDFCDPDALRGLIAEIPSPDTGNVNLSRDYIFAKEKYEKSDIQKFGDRSNELYEDLLSDRFKSWLQFVIGEAVFVDPKFHGGGFHQGGKGSFLDMHADFNYHPLHDDWFRNLNILLYLNEGWKPSYGGSLKLRHGVTGDRTEIEPLFNRCVIMHTRDYTLHGYAPICFPDGTYRRSVAAYAYKFDEARSHGAARSTTWHPEQGGTLKKVIGKAWPRLVAIKTSLFGSGTARNQ